MIINPQNLKTLQRAFNAAFKQGAGMAANPLWNKVATRVPSSTGIEEYGWLGQFPGMRKWLGDRVIHGMQTHGYTIKNEPFEMTVGVNRDHIDDDNYGIYTPMFQEMGRANETHPDELVFSLLKKGPSTLCYDGQYFFDTDHPVIAADGSVTSQSNWDNNSGAGTPWFLLDGSRALKPIIYQDRKPGNFVALDHETDENVFMRKEFIYGVDARRNVGFGFWQMAQGSRKDLNEANLQAAYTAMTERKGDHGRPLNIKPTLLVVPPSQKFKAANLINASRLANGQDNVMKDLVEVVDVAWLA